MFTRTHLLIGMLVFAGIILYGSLVPLQYQPMAWNEMVDRFQAVCSTRPTLTSKSDFLANVMLFVPLSFLMMGWLSLERPQLGWCLAAPVVVACVTYGAFIEFIQLLFPPRSSSINDIVAQGMGSVSGAFLWLFLGQRLLHLSSTLFKRWGSFNPLAPLIPLYLVVIVILETAPFDFTLSPVEVVHKWREGRIHLLPFAAFFDPDRSMIVKSIWNMILFLPIGLTLGYRQKLHTPSVVILSLLLAGGVELLQLPVLSRHFEPTDIFTGSLAICLGYYVMQQNVLSFSLRPVLFAVWLGVILYLNWTPFDFTTNGVGLRMSELSLVPFADYQQKHYLTAFDDLVHKLVLFMMLGVLLAGTSTFRHNIFFATCMGALLAGLIELGQVFLPSRYPSISDVVLGAAACWAGSTLVSMVKAPPMLATSYKVPILA